jgi:hypothetical protein
MDLRHQRASFLTRVEGLNQRRNVVDQRSIRIGPPEFSATTVRGFAAANGGDQFVLAWRQIQVGAVHRLGLERWRQAGEDQRDVRPGGGGDRRLGSFVFLATPPQHDVRVAPALVVLDSQPARRARPQLHDRRGRERRVVGPAVH